MEQGPNEKDIINLCIRRGQSLPEAMANAPELFRGLEFYYNAFQDLCSTRPVGMGFGQISWLSCDAYAQRKKLSEDEAEELWYYVTQMDTVWLTHHNKARQDKMAAAKQAAGE